MKRTFPILISLASLSFANPVALLGSTEHKPSEQELKKEYEQARKIALKDPKVRAAYEKADEKLNDRIVDIDPTLKEFVEKRKAAPQPKQEKAQPAKHAVIAKKQPEQGATTHVVTKGETLSAIAMHYKVNVDSLKSVNGITDEKKLQVGQVLKIPSGSHSQIHVDEKNDTWWNRLKKSI